MPEPVFEDAIPIPDSNDAYMRRRLYTGIVFCRPQGFSYAVCVAAVEIWDDGGDPPGIGARIVMRTPLRSWTSSLGNGSGLRQGVADSHRLPDSVTRAR